VAITRSVDAVYSFLRACFDAAAQLLQSDVVTSHRTLQPWMIQIAFGIGGLLAFFAAISASAGYFPSIVNTTLKFRSGVIPSLRDPNFANYRQSVHRVTLITGSMFWVRCPSDCLAFPSGGFPGFLLLRFYPL